MNERLLDYLLDELAPGERAAFESDPHAARRPSGCARS